MCREKKVGRSDDGDFSLPPYSFPKKGVKKSIFVAAKKENVEGSFRMQREIGGRDLCAKYPFPEGYRLNSKSKRSVRAISMQ